MLINTQYCLREIDSKIVIPSYNVTDSRVSLSLSKDLASYKLYIADTGLFITLMFIDRPAVENEIYAKLLSDKLPVNLGYLYGNLINEFYNSVALVEALLNSKGQKA